MNQIDDIAHLIQLSIAPVFLLTGVGTLLNVLSGRLARIIDRSRVLEHRLDTPEPPHASAIVYELHVLERRGKLIHRMWRGLYLCHERATRFAQDLRGEPRGAAETGYALAAGSSPVPSHAVHTPLP